MVTLTFLRRLSWLCSSSTTNNNFIKDKVLLMSKFGLYIHIPFCLRKCLYCDFLSFDSCNRETQEKYVTKLISEIKAKAYEYNDRIISSIFIGGGTPSVLTTEQTGRIMKAAFDSFAVADDAEITTEANPGTVSLEKLQAYRSYRINRISFGLQSTNNEELNRLGRIHDYNEFLEAYGFARQAGFENINVDLMSALPGQSIESYEESLRKVIALNPEHISAYSLIVEEGTPFYSMYSDGKGLPSEDEDRQMYADTKKILAKSGYYRYEISNYAKKGYESRHNSLYWERGEYLGVGLGASSFIGNERWKNEDDLNRYLGGNFLEKNELTKLSRNDELEEIMFLGMRMMKGVKETSEITEKYGDLLNKQEQEGLIVRKDGMIKLSEHGIDISNYVFADYINV